MTDREEIETGTVDETERNDNEREEREERERNESNDTVEDPNDFKIEWH